MKPSVLIPLSALALGACSPAYIGDFDLTAFTMSYDGEPLGTAGSTGSLSIDDALAAEVRINWSYDGDALTLALDGDAVDGDGDAFSLDLEGTVSDGQDGYAISADFACTADDDAIDCDGSFLINSYTYPAALDFERE